MDIKNIDKNSIQKYVYDHLKDKNVLTANEINECVDEACKGVTVIDIATALEHNIFCEKCGECCRYCDPIVINDVEIGGYSKYFGKRFDNYFINKNGKWYLKKTKPCAFLSINNTCHIFDMRPSVCRGYPFNFVVDEIKGFEINSKCKLIENLYKFKSLSFVSRRIIEKKEPELHKKLDELAVQSFEGKKKFSGNYNQDIVSAYKIMEKIKKDLE